MTEPQNDELPEHLKNNPLSEEYLEQFDLGNFHNANYLLPDLDYCAQYEAINNLLRLHKSVEATKNEAIEKIRADAQQLTGMWNERAEEEYINQVHSSAYQEAAHSMAAVGMLAPLIESIFHQAFLNIGARQVTATEEIPNHSRLSLTNRDAWDCHFFWGKNGSRNKDLVKGVIQLSDAIDLTPDLPSNLNIMLEALFGYRNKMFHCGLEWGNEERNKFSQRIEGWPKDWFEQAKQGGELWMFYLSDYFIAELLDAVVQILEAFGAYAFKQIKDSGLKKPAQ